MNVGVIFIAIIYIAVQVIATQQKKKKQEEQKARQMPQAERPQPARVPDRTPARPRQSSVFPGLEDLFPDVDTSPARPAPQRKPQPPRRMPADDRFPDLTPAPKQGSLGNRTSEGLGTGRSMADRSGEGKSGAYQAAVQSVQPGARHVVQAMTESSHHHMESSMTGIEPACPPEAAPPTQAQQAQTKADAAYNLPTAAGRRQFAFDRGSVVQGFLYGEILGKPRALRH